MVGMRLSDIREGPERSVKMSLFQPRCGDPLDPFPSAPSRTSDRRCGFVDKHQATGSGFISLNPIWDREGYIPG